jgi:3-oxoacyl-[acyl-carrier-protein] synthase II
MVDPSTRRVCITGMGLVSPLGNSVDELWSGLTSGRSGVDRLQNLSELNLPTRYAAEARGFTGHIDNFGPLEAAQKKTIRKGLKVMCREIQMGVAAAQLALHDAGLQAGQCEVDRTGVVYGCDYMMTVPEEFTEGIRACTDEQGFHFSRWAEAGMRKVDPLWLLKYLPNMPACHVAIYNDLRGPNNSITLREASANLAIAEAYCTIARGSADTMIAGATGSRVHPLRTLHIVLQEELATHGDDPTKLSRPFDLHRQGSVLGEGAAAIVLEELTGAQKRGARVLAEIVGYGSSTVVDHNGVANCGLAIENAIRAALRSARMSSLDIGHLQAHGLGTRYSDREEAQAIQRVFGDRSLPVTTTKGHMGNVGAAGGTIGLIASISALRHGHLFPILNYQTPDPECPINAAAPETPSGSSFVNVNVSPIGQASAVIVRRMAE